MSVTRERLEARLAEFKQQLEQIKQQYNATIGVIADLEYWLAEDAKPAEKE